MSPKIYVGNLSFNTMEESLRELFQQFGDVSSCKVVVDRDTGKSKGFGFIEMTTTDEAQQAIHNLDGRDMDGRNIQVNEAKPRTRKSW